MNRTSRFSTLRGGISIGSENVTAGTLTGRFLDTKDNKIVMLSNWHVFEGAPSKTLILQPGQYDGGTVNDYVGVLKRYVKLNGEPSWPLWKKIICMLFGWFLEEYCYAGGENYIDGAIASFEPAKSDRMLKSGIYLDDGNILIPRNSHHGDGIANRKVYKVGRTTGLTYGTVKYDSSIVKVWYGDRIITFKDQLIIEGLARPGDSGSPVFLLSNSTPSEHDAFVGLLFAGSSEYYIASKYKYIECLLNAKYITE